MCNETYEDESAKRFVDLLRASGIIKPEILDNIISEFYSNKPVKSDRTAQSISEFLITKKIVTAWQAGQIKEGRYKGGGLKSQLQI